MKRLHGLLVSTLTVGLLSVPAFADLVHLKNGRVIEGKVRRENGRIYIQQPDGVVIISEDKIDHIEPKESILDVYEGKLRDIDPKGADASKQYADLGKWCQDKGMSNQANECYQRSIGIDPANDLANSGLGRVKYNGRWMTLEEANQARGMVKHGDAWVSPEAKSDLVKLDSAKELQEKNLELEKMKVEVARLEAEKAAAEAEKARAQAETERYRRTIVITDPYLQGYVPVVPGYGPGRPPHRPEAPRKSSSMKFDATTGKALPPETECEDDKDKRTKSMTLQQK